MRVRLEHRTRYDYEKPVSFSPHFVRLFPRTEPGRLVQRIEFTTNASATVQFRRDLFDNNFARCFYPDKETFLFHDLITEIELQELNPFDFLLDFDAADYPFTYDATTAARLAPYLTPPPAESGQVGGPALLPLPFWEKPATPTPTVTVLGGLMDAIHTHIRYERRDEGAAHPPAETLRLGHGSCRDFGVLLANVLRELGLAARLASGYLCEFGTETGDRRADGAMHLWTEVYLPGAGWTGLDATNGIFCNHNFITTAVGLTSAEVTPISGRYFSNEVVPSHMTASLTLQRL